MRNKPKKEHVKATNVRKGDILSILTDHVEVANIEETTDGWIGLVFDFTNGTSYHAGYEDYLLKIGESKSR